MNTLEGKIHDYKMLSARASEGFPLDPPWSQRRRAEMESEIWGLVPFSERKVKNHHHGRGHWLAMTFGGSSADYQHRCQLLSWGPAVDVLWTRVEEDMTLSTVIELLRKAKKLPGEMPEAVLRAVAEYDALPMATKQADGKIVRKRATARLPSLKESRVHRRDSPKVRAAGTETIWNRLRAELGGYVAGRLEGLDPRIGEEVYRDFERDLNGLLSEYQQKIDRVRSSGAATFKVSRRLVIDACAVLALDPPSPGRPADLVLARRQQRRLAKIYHPDTNMGDESMRAQYERVMQAYERLDAYNVGLGKKALEESARRIDERASKVNGAAEVVVTEAAMGNEKENDHGRGSQSGAQ